jgi:cell pole-organizing protein PopZ
MRQAGEPTVEEILESIKKVIARDNRAGAAEERRHREFEGIAEPEEDPIEGEDVLDLAEDAALDDEIEEAQDRPLLTEDAQSSMRESLAALALLSEPGAQPQIVRSGETSLEGLVRDLLRPALADWLDKNLPPLVERMVAAEIARIVSKRG